MKWHVFAATVLLVLVTLACKKRSSTSTYTSTTTTTAEPAPASTEEADKATVKTKMATMDTIAAAKLPSITTKPTVAKKGPKPILDGQGAGANAALVAASSMPISLEKKMMSFEPLALPFCAAWAQGKKEDLDSSYLHTCRDIKYLVVLRFSSRVDPKMVTSTTFRGGQAAGDATVFDVDTGERLGAVPFSAQNYDKLEAMQGGEIGRAVADLEGQCAHVVQTGLDTAWGE